MRRLTCAVMCALTAAGCGGGSGERAAPSAPPPASASSTSSPPGDLSGNDRLAYMTELAGIDPGLVVNEAETIRRGEQTCADIARGVRGDELAERVRRRFTGGSVPLDAARAERIVTVVKQRVCKP